MHPVDDCKLRCWRGRGALVTFIPEFIERENKQINFFPAVYLSSLVEEGER
jgi:hypothetical protein